METTKVNRPPPPMQACSALNVVPETSAKFGLHAAKYKIQYTD